MYTFIDRTEYEQFSMASFDRYFEGKKIGFFDIETTGLKADKSGMILSGIAIPDGDTLVAKQFLAETLEDEIEVIEATLKEFADLDVVVTYNGNGFDIPFLVRRCRKLGIDVPPLPYDLDIYRVVNRFSPLRKFLPNLSQKTVEAFLGLWKNRDDEISGRDSIALYSHYAATGDEEARDIVLLHNHDDICQLSRLMPVLTKTDFDKAMSAFGFPAGNDVIKSIKLKHNEIVCSGIQRIDPVDYELYDDFNSGSHISADRKTGTFRMNIPVRSGDKYTVADLRLLGIDSSCFDEAPEDFLILKQDKSLNWGNINSLIIEMVRLLMGKARDQ